MAKRVSPTLIGVFVLGAFALTVGVVLVLGGRQWLKRPVSCVMAFDGSVAGLTVGAPVRFRGVPLGTVSDIQIRYGSTGIVVLSEIDPSRIQGLRRDIAPADVDRVVQEAVRKGLRAQLQLESLVTGQLYVGLDFAPETPAQLTGNTPDQCEIPTIPTALAQFQEEMRRIVTGLEQLPLKQTLEAVGRAGDAIAKIASAPEIHTILGSTDRTMHETENLVHRLNAQLDPVIGNVQATLDDAQRTLDGVGGDMRHLIRDVDARVPPLAGSIGNAADSVQALMRDGQNTLHRLDQEIGPTLAAFRRASDAANDAMRRAEAAFGHADGLLDGKSALGYRLAEALDEFTRTARALRSLSEDIERQPNLLLLGREGAQNR
ncbi:MAG TPA: MlaD family protein [Candidatus Baltobacteraceae bacterium]|nr:MlaD family protein [Candidatus Baltobacteraceae bacterium]